MKTRFVQIIFTLCLVAMFVLTLTFTSVAQADNGVRQDGSGKYAEWTALWWQWILEQPATGNPIFDTTGADAAKGQPLKKVFFLAGAFGGSVTRNITVPSGVGLFMPLVNGGGISFPLPNPKPKDTTDQVPQLRTLYAAPFIDSINPETELFAALDGVSLLNSVERVKSPVFRVTSLEKDSMLDTGTYVFVSDGYWLYIPPLAPGTYVLHFGCSTAGGFVVDVTDVITVQ